MDIGRNGPPGGEPGRSPAEQEVHTRLGVLVADMGLDPGIAEAYTPEQDSLYAYEGIADRSVSVAMTQHKIEAISGIASNYDNAFRRGFVYDQLRRQPRQIREAALSVSHDVSEPIMNYFLSRPSGGDWVKYVTKTASEGLNRNEVVCDLAIMNQLHYFFEVEAGDQLAQDELYTPIIGSVFEPEERDTPILLSDIAQRLREKGLVDLSKEHLDARVEHFAAVTQLELSSYILEDLSIRAMFGGRSLRRAQLLATKYKYDLFEDDYMRKLHIMLEVADSFTDCVRRVGDPRVKNIFRTVAQRAEKTASDAYNWLQGFLPVYKRLGYEPHSLLDLPEEVEAAKEFVDILVHLRDLSAANDQETARSLLAGALSEERSIWEEFQLISIVAADAGITVAPPSIVPLSRLVDAFRSDWPTFREMILKTWPHYEGVVAIGHLETLLFASRQTIEVSPEAQNAIEFQLSIAQQLDRIVLPPRATQRDLDRELQRLSAPNTGAHRIDWQRLRILIELREMFSGSLFRSKKRTLGGGASYFVAVVSLEDDTFAIAETARTERASYVVCQRLAAGTWLEVLSLRIDDASQVGAYQVTHSRGSGTPHLDKICDKMLELHALPHGK